MCVAKRQSLWHRKIQIIKLYGWEPSFQDQIEGIRSDEIQILKKHSYWGVGFSFLLACTQALVALITFATYVLIDENNVLDSQKAFVALSLFNIMQFPMAILPMFLAFLAQVCIQITKI